MSPAPRLTRRNRQPSEDYAALSGRVASPAPSVVHSTALALLKGGATALSNAVSQAYVALAGGLLRYGDSQTVHPFWERNAGLVIRTLAQATHDEDGAEQREREAIYSTKRRLREGGEATGFTRLAEYIGEESVKIVERLVRDAEAVAGFVPDVAGDVPGWQPPWARQWDGLKIELDETAPAPAFVEAGDSAEPRSLGALLPEHGSEPAPEADVGRGDDDSDGEVHEDLDPLDARPSSWSPVDLEPYLTGKLKVPDPEVCRRNDGACLMYRGRVNMLFGSSESAKSWIAMAICLQEIETGGRALYLDFEDDFLDELFDAMEAKGLRAVTYMPPRNTPAQLERVHRLAAAHGMLEISGVDINQPRQAFNCPELRRPEFAGLNEATWALVAHEALSSVDPALHLLGRTGRLGPDRLAQRIAQYAPLGRRIADGEAADRVAEDATRA